MKKLFATMLISTAALAIGGQAFAAEEEGLKREGTTDIGVTFKSDDINVPGEGPFKNNLTLAWMPSAFNFGTQKVTGDSITVNAAPVASDKEQPYLVVNDNREEAAEKAKAFTVTAKLSQFTSTTDDTKKLDGKLVLTMAPTEAYNMGTKEITKPDGTIDIEPNRPAGDALTPADDVLKKALDFKGTLVGDDYTFTLDSTAAGATELYSKLANENVTGIANKVKNAQLTILKAESSKAAGQSFTGQITWTLGQTV